MAKQKVLMENTAFNDDAQEAALYANTPYATVFDNRGLSVRALQYNRTPTAPMVTTLGVSRRCYSAAGYPLSDADPRLWAAGLTNFDYVSDLLGQPLRTDSRDAGTRWMMHDIEGRLIWQCDGRSTITRWRYDMLGRVVTISDQLKRADSKSADSYQVLPLQVRERFMYGDIAGQPSTQNQEANLRGALNTYWDEAGRLSVLSVSLSGKPCKQKRGLLASPQGQGDWSSANEQDWWAQLDKVSYFTHWSYDAWGAQLSQQDAMLNTQTLTYDVAGRLCGSTLTVGYTNKTQPLLVAVSYSAAGQIEETRAGNGVTTTYAYEPQTQRLIGVRTQRPARSGRKTQLQALHYTYDPVGNIVSIADHSQSETFTLNQKVSAQNAYQYDALYQLVSASGREQANAPEQSAALPAPIVPPVAGENVLVNYQRKYFYDMGGNVQRIQHQGARAYTHQIVVSETSNRAMQQNANGSLTPQTVDAPQRFDGSGNSMCLQPDQTQPLCWNGRNQLSVAIQVSRDTLQMSDRQTYQYDGNGMRVRKTTFSYHNNGQTQQCDQVIYLPGLELRTRTTTAHQKTSTLELLHVITAGNAGHVQARLLHWEAGKPGDIPNDQLRYSLGNQIGSVTLELDGAAQLVTWEEYYPFGGTAVQGASSLSEVKYKFVRYSGKERDMTGLYDYGLRYYQPWIGRWLNPDPAGAIDGLNLFRMVANNPITLADANGTTGRYKKTEQRVIDQGAFDGYEEKIFKKMMGGQSKRRQRQIAAEAEGQATRHFNTFDKNAQETLSQAFKNYTEDSARINAAARSMTGISENVRALDKALVDFKEQGSNMRVVYRLMGYKEKEMLSPYHDAGANSIEIGDVVREPAFMSTSEHRGFLISGIQNETENTRYVKFALLTKAGVNISSLSPYTNKNEALLHAMNLNNPRTALSDKIQARWHGPEAGQAEILLPRGAEFEVVGQKRKGNSVFVLMQENNKALDHVKNVYTGEVMRSHHLSLS